MHKLPNIKTALLTLFITVILVSSISCANYNKFTSDFQVLNFSFEYPQKWKITDPEISQEYAYFNLINPDSPENESKLVIGLNNWVGMGDKAGAEALSKVQDHIEKASEGPNFSLIRQEEIVLDGAKGYVGEYFYDRPDRYDNTSQTQSYFNMREMDICVVRDGNVYEIWVSASQKNWDKNEKDIQHLLDTFRWR